MGLINTANHQIEVDTRKIRHGARPEFENLFGRYAMGQDYQGINVPVGTIKNLALAKGIKEIRVDGKKLGIDRGDPAKCIDGIEEVVLDELEEEGIDPYNKFLEFVVASSPWLARKDPFRMVFQPFLPSDMEAENPTQDT